MVLIENRLINPKMIIEISQEVKELITFEEQYTQSGSITKPVVTGKWFSTVFIMGVEPINVTRDSKEEVKEEIERIKKRLEGYLF
jgi:hypothetical protein